METPSGLGFRIFVAFGMRVGRYGGLVEGFTA